MASIKSAILLVLLHLTSALGQSYHINPASFINTRCSDSDKLATPTWGDSEIVYTVCAEKLIHAPVAKVYDAILNFDAYSTWNTFVVDVVARGNSSLTPAPPPIGTQMTFTTNGLIGPLQVPAPEMVSVELPDVDGSGKYAMNAWIFDVFEQRVEHPNVLTDLGDGWTRYVSWESYYVGMVGLSVLLEGQLKECTERQADDLKKYVEG